MKRFLITGFLLIAPLVLAAQKGFSLNPQRTFEIGQEILDILR
jgi:hypothetical protein